MKHKNHWISKRTEKYTVCLCTIISTVITNSRFVNLQKVITGSVFKHSSERRAGLKLCQHGKLCMYSLLVGEIIKDAWSRVDYCDSGFLLRALFDFNTFSMNMSKNFFNVFSYLQSTVFKLLRSWPWITNQLDSVGLLLERDLSMEMRNCSSKRRIFNISLFEFISGNMVRNII